MNRAATVLVCLAAFILSALALCVSLATLHNRGLGFGFTPLCIVPALAVATLLGVMVAKKKASVRWIIAPTIAASAVLLWFAQFLFGEYRKHGKETIGGGGHIVVLILFGLGAVLAVIYAVPAASVFLQSKKNEKTG